VNDYGVDLDVVARLAVALVLGAIVGIEREVRDQPAGLRTHISVALGAALFGVISTTRSTSPAWRLRWWWASASSAPG
jgi:putative Mg2+ transporter-C (MgtC) family protein